MKLGTQDTIRVAYLVMAGLMLTGASTVWNTAGYLNVFAWVLEWTGILLAFYFIMACVQIKDCFICWQPRTGQIKDVCEKHNACCKTQKE